LEVGELPAGRKVYIADCVVGPHKTRHEGYIKTAEEIQGILVWEVNLDAVVVYLPGFLINVCIDTTTL
jgi:hypothetical protein